METEITAALIACGGAICASTIAFGGVIIGYLLQVLQKRWSRGDKMREWRRGKLEEFWKPYNEMAGLVGKIYMMGKLEPQDKIDLSEYLTSAVGSLPPVEDSELLEIYEKFLKAVGDFFETIIEHQGERKILERKFEEVVEFGTKFSSRIDKLIEKTYK